jgi:hypothetical protein
MRRKEDFWQMVLVAAVVSGRKTNDEAVKTADQMVQEFEKRFPRDEIGR